MPDETDLFYLTGGQRRLIIDALALLQEALEAARPDEMDKHEHWKMLLRIRQCREATRLLQSSGEGEAPGG